MPVTELASRLADVLCAPTLQQVADGLVDALRGTLDAEVAVGAQDVWRPLAVTPGTDATDLGTATDDGVRVTELTRADGRSVRLTTRGEGEETEAAAALTVAVLRAAIDRLDALDRATDAQQRLVDNERIGGIGSYDWNILTDTNRWSDELYRIYGFEPQSFNASYDRFIALIHPDDRDRIRAVHARAYETGEPYEMEERVVRPDGSVRLLWSNGEVIRDDDGTPIRMIGVCRDVTEQRAAEEEARHAAERVAQVELRRRQAMELNDNVVQGLVLLLWKLEADDLDDAHRVAERTLNAARKMMDDLLVAEPEGPSPGSLVRREAPLLVTRREPGPTDAAADGDAAEHAAASDTSTTPPTATASGADENGRVRVLIADDTADLRMLLRLHLQREGDFQVVAEASDGDEAVRLTVEHRPDVVVIDLAMPTTDGLEATSRIRAAVPDVRIVVHSGYGDASVRSRALEAGADAYLEKQADLGPLVAWLRDHHVRA